jgi:hypothetical protein
VNTYLYFYKFHKLQSLDDSICMKRQLVIGLIGLELQDGGGKKFNPSCFVHGERRLL